MFFTYVNPVVQYGAARFAAAARAAGALGAIVPDVPLEELAAFAPAFHARRARDPAARRADDAARARGADRGGRATASSTSSRGSASPERGASPTWPGFASAVAALRATTKKPLAVGFGISTPAHVAAIGAIADGVIIGSAFIDAIAGRSGADAAAAARAYVDSLRAAL